MEIRRITLDDITARQFLEIVDIENHCGLEPFSIDMISGMIYAACTYAVFDRDHIVAFISVDERGAYFSNDLYILNLNVSKYYRRKGLAEALIQHVAKVHTKCKVVSLDVSLDNSKALKLYWKLGFVRTDRKSVNGNTDVVMKADRETLSSLPIEVPVFLRA